MNTHKARLAVVLFAVLSTAPLAAQQTPAPAPAADRPAILILGSVHFKGSTADLFSTPVADILSEKRQREVTAMVAALKRYQPTKVAVERTAESIGKVNEQYQAYLRGERTLDAGEVEQIAFRLAKELGHQQLYAADTQLDMDFEGLMATAAKGGQQAMMDKAMAIGRSAVAEIGQRLQAETLGDFFRWFNSPEMLAASHRPYLYLAQVGTAADPKGVDVLAGWYKRNLLIYSNLVRMADSPNERILLLIGQGHAKLLSEYVSESPNLRLEDPLKYLP